MKNTMASLIVPVSAVLLQQASAVMLQARVTPTVQVINMLKDMHAKGTKNQDTEKRTYASYAEWVDDRKKDLAFEIQDGKAVIEEHLSFIAKTDSDAKQLGHGVAALDAEINKLS